LTELENCGNIRTSIKEITMTENTYVIYNEPNEEPYIVIHGIFSKTELLLILNEVKEKQELTDDEFGEDDEV
jgi:hypothetical protein